MSGWRRRRGLTSWGGGGGEAGIRFWMAYCYIHLGEFQAAMNQIDEHLKYDNGNSTPPPRCSSPPSRPAADPEPMAWLWKAICHFGLGQYKAVEECALRCGTGHGSSC